MVELLFSARGRLNRARFWGASLAVGVGGTVLLGVLLWLFGVAAPGAIDADGTLHVEGVAALPYIAAVLAYAVVCTWAGVCLGIKRYHDQDKPGVWILVVLIPLVGSLIYFIQAGCLPGTPGPNRYGSDPLMSP